MLENEDFSFNNLITRVTDENEALRTDLAEIRGQNEYLSESLADLAYRLDTVGWVPADNWSEEEGFTLDSLRNVSKILTEMVASHPLIRRADQLRNDYVFGRGMHFVPTTGKKLPPKVTKAIESTYNAQAVFSRDAWGELQTTLLTDGNLFLLWDKDSQLYTRVPLSQIEAVYTDPDSSERIWYVKRTWTSHVNGTGVSKSVWYPVAGYTGTRRNSIKGVRVNNRAHMHIKYGKRFVGHTFGMPLGFAAIAWAVAYSAYLKNNLKLVETYARIAYKISGASTKSGAAVSAKVSMPGETAGVAVMDKNKDIVPMPRSGSDVSFDNARAVAAYVAAVFGVSVVALTSDPGAAGSSYGSAQTLDAPTIIGMTSIQESWKLFYQELFENHAPDANPVTVQFPLIESDPLYRLLQSYAQAHAQGALHRSEYRKKVLELLDIEDPEKGLPEPDEFIKGNGGSDPTPRQGNSGAVGSIDQGTNNDGRTDTISK